MGVIEVKECKGWRRSWRENLVCLPTLKTQEFPHPARVCINSDSTICYPKCTSQFKCKVGCVIISSQVEAKALLRKHKLGWKEYPFAKLLLKWLQISNIIYEPWTLVALHLTFVTKVFVPLFKKLASFTKCIFISREETILFRGSCWSNSRVNKQTKFAGVMHMCLDDKDQRFQNSQHLLML